MWARVKGRTENALLKLGFTRVYLLRPGFIQPVKGVRFEDRLVPGVLYHRRPVVAVDSPAVSWNRDDHGGALGAP